MGDCHFQREATITPSFQLCSSAFSTSCGFTGPFSVVALSSVHALAAVRHSGVLIPYLGSDIAANPGVSSVFSSSFTRLSPSSVCHPFILRLPFVPLEFLSRIWSRHYGKPQSSTTEHDSLFEGIGAISVIYPRKQRWHCPQC